MSGHFGMPGPGGSLGVCAVCGGPFAAEILMGREVSVFSVGFIDETLYCHIPKCKETLKEAFRAAEGEFEDDMDRNRAVRDALPDGPLRGALADAITRLESGS